jgi:hypothetical protein
MMSLSKQRISDWDATSDAEAALAGWLRRLARALSRLWLFRVPPEPRDTASVIAWWEVRRAAYNVIMLAVGLPSLLAFAWLTERLWARPTAFDDFLAQMVIPGLMANVCYTAGWMSELVARLRSGKPPTLFGPFALGLGLAFSLAVALAPTLLLLVQWLLR